MTSPTIQQRLRHLQLIYAALAMGTITFAIIVFALNKPATLTGSPLTILRVACASLLAMSFLVPTLLRRATVQHLANRTGATELDCIGPYVGLSIIKAAIAESAGLLASVTFMMSADQMDLLLIGGALAVLAAMVPTQGRWDGFVEDVKRSRV